MTAGERLRVTALRVRDYLAVEHDEFYPLAVVERAVSKWVALEVERLLEDGAEILTTPRFHVAQDFQAGLARSTQENKRLGMSRFRSANLTEQCSVEGKESVRI